MLTPTEILCGRVQEIEDQITSIIVRANLGEPVRLQEFVALALAGTLYIAQALKEYHGQQNG